MSHARLTPSAIAAFFTMFLLSSSAYAVDWTCESEVEYCLALERDNVTIYVDSDGSMNASSGEDMSGDGDWQDDSYWEWAQQAVAAFASDAQVTGTSCDASDCESNQCDEVRVGLGYFGDNSASQSGDMINAYRAVQAGEDRAAAVAASLAGEAVGTVGLPGLETLTCPTDGPGQTGTFTCPPNGIRQVERVYCPKDGTSQTDTIICPVDGVAQVSRLRCPPTGRAKIWQATPLLYSLPITYTINIAGETLSYPALALTDPIIIATDLESQALGNSSITDNFIVTRTSATLRFEHKTTGIDFPASIAGLFSTLVVQLPAVGLPDTPSDGTDVEFRFNNSDPYYTVTTDMASTSTSVCTALRDEINANSNNSKVSATVLPGGALGDILELTSTVAGRAFTTTNLSNLTNLGTIVANVNGLPNQPGLNTEYRIRIAMMGNDEPSYFSAAPNDRATVCQAIANMLDSSSKPVSATYVAPDRVVVVPDVTGASFTLSPRGSTPTGTYGLTFSTIAGSPGLPGTPTSGTVLGFQVNGQTANVTTSNTSSSLSVCNELKTAVDGLSQPVLTSVALDAISGRYYLEIQADLPGRQFTLAGSFGASVTGLTRQTINPGMSGLPGTPGPTFNYDFSYDDVWGGSTNIAVPSTGPLPLPDRAQICTNLANAINAHPHFIATTNLTTVSVTPQIPGLRWTFSGIPSALSYANGPAQPNLPYSPGPLTDYGLTINGTNIPFVDDGHPTQAEICTGVAASITANSTAARACAYPDMTCEIPTMPGLLVIRGTSSAAFDVQNYHGSMMHNVVRPAGVGPSSYAALSQRIGLDLGINDRRQNAIVVTHRPPLTYADFEAARANLCLKRNDMDTPATTWFIGMDLTGRDKELMDVLAAAGGSGSCSIDPCVTSPVTALNFATYSGTTCNGSFNDGADGLKSRLDSITRKFSCTFDLKIPASYVGGQAPKNTSAISIKVDEWNLGGFTGPGAEVWHLRDGTNDYDDYLEDQKGVTDASNYRDHGWYFPAGTQDCTGLYPSGQNNNYYSSCDRSRITFSSRICDDIRSGRITKLRSHVGCLCSNQGGVCTAAVGTYTCKSLTAGEPDGLCTAEQLAKMRCATGVYVCTDAGDEVCTADPTNIMPEICNGIDDDCDGVVDNMSESVPAQFGAEDPLGKNCNYQNTCSCPSECTDDGMGNTICLPYSGDVPSLSFDIAEHLDSYSGACTCGDGLEADYSEAPTTDDDAPFANSEDAAACSIGFAGAGAGNAVLIFSLLGMLGIWRRRRR